MASSPPGWRRQAELTAEGDCIQLADKRFRRELASWVHPNRTKSRDGIPGYAFGFGDPMPLAGPFVIRTFDTGKGQAAKDRQIAEGSPFLAVLGAEGDALADWLDAEQALARVLLRARAEGVWASFLNKPIEVPELRPRVREIVGKAGFPQLLLRMGYGAQEVRATPRRTTYNEQGVAVPQVVDRLSVCLATPAPRVGEEHRGPAHEPVQRRTQQRNDEGVIQSLASHPQLLARLKFSQASQNSPRYFSHSDVSKTSQEPLMPISLA